MRKKSLLHNFMIHTMKTFHSVTYPVLLQTSLSQHSRQKERQEKKKEHAILEHRYHSAAHLHPLSTLYPTLCPPHSRSDLKEVTAKTLDSPLWLCTLLRRGYIYPPPPQLSVGVSSAGGYSTVGKEALQGDFGPGLSQGRVRSRVVPVEQSRRRKGGPLLRAAWPPGGGGWGKPVGRSRCGHHHGDRAQPALRH